MSDPTDLRETVEDLVWQFAHRTTSNGVPVLTAGGLSALEGAFAVLGWSDPFPCPDKACEQPGCGEWASCGTPTTDGYKHFCGRHFRTAALADS